MSNFRENQAIEGGHLQNGSSFSGRDNWGRRNSNDFDLQQINNNQTYIIDKSDNSLNCYSDPPSPPSGFTLPPEKSVDIIEIRQKLKALERDQEQRYCKETLEREMEKEEKDDMRLEILQEKEDLVVKLLSGEDGYRKEFETQRTRLKRERGRLCDPKFNPAGCKRMQAKIFQSQVDF